MRSPYLTRRRRTRRPLGCLALIIGTAVLLAVLGSRTARNWGVPSLAPRPTPTASPARPAPLVQAPAPPAAIAVSDTAAPSPDPDPYRQWIHEARAQYPYPESEAQMLAVMACESGGDAASVSPDGANYGLFQYSLATWAGDWNPYRDAPIRDARAQIFATARAWNLGMQGQWGCYAATPR